MRSDSARSAPSICSELSEYCGRSRLSSAEVSADQVVAIGLRTEWTKDLYHYLLVLPWSAFIAGLFLVYFGLNLIFAALYLLGDGALYLASFDKVREAIATDGIVPADGPKTALNAIASFDPTVKADKIDLSKLFGGADAINIAAQERDRELVADGRQAVGLSVGIPKRQANKGTEPKDDLDKLMDSLDALDL